MSVTPLTTQNAMEKIRHRCAVVRRSGSGGQLSVRYGGRRHIAYSVTFTISPQDRHSVPIVISVSLNGSNIRDASCLSMYIKVEIATNMHRK